MSLKEEWQKFMLQNDFYVKKSLGQNFLQNKCIVEKILSFAVLKDTVLEIGPGTGFLTEALLVTQGYDKLVLLEKDRTLFDFLLTQIKKDHVQILLVDALGFFNSNNHMSFGKINVVANLPYNISKSLIMSWLNRKEINSATIMLQKEVALSLVAQKSKEYKPISVFVNIFFHVKICFYVGRNHFFPIPNVDSAVVQLIRKKTLLNSEFQSLKYFVDLCFQQRRKKLSNLIPTDFQINFDQNLRAENISPDGFLEATMQNLLLLEEMIKQKKC